MAIEKLVNQIAVKVRVIQNMSEISLKLLRAILKLRMKWLVVHTDLTEWFVNGISRGSELNGSYTHLTIILLTFKCKEFTNAFDQRAFNLTYIINAELLHFFEGFGKVDFLINLESE